MRRISLLVLAVVLAGCGSSSPVAKKLAAPTLDAGWTEFKSDEHKFTLGIPKGWIPFDFKSKENRERLKDVLAKNPQFEAAINNAMSQPGMALSAGDPASVADGYMDSLNVIHKTGLKLSSLDDKAVSDFRRGLESSLPPGVTDTSVNKVPVAVGDALLARVLMDVKMPDGSTAKVVTLSYFIPNGTESYNVTFASLASKEAKIAALAKKVADTMRVTG